MNDKRGFDRAVDRWLDDGSDATPPEVIDAVLRAARGTPQERDFRTSWRTPPAKRLAYAAVAVAVLAVSLTALSALSTRFGIGPGPTHPDEPSVDLGIFEPVAGRIVYGDGSGMRGVDPAAPEDPATSVELTSEGLIPLGWSSDGTRLLAMRQHAGGSLATSDLFILDGDGSETQVTEQPVRIRGAAISPDGSRVAFAGSPETPEGDWALYAVDANGGPAELLVESRIGILDELAFSPDGMRIAYADGAGDNNHHVWVMNADGTDAHEIVTRDCACHVYGLAWSPAGDRIALGIEGTIYTFAPDGSEFTRVITNGDTPYWSPDGSRIAYTVSCVEDANGCGLAVADADGSNVRAFGSGASGPWHPGVASLPAPDPTMQPTQTQPPPETEAVFDVALHSYDDMSGGVVRAPEPTLIHAQLPDGWVADESGMSMNSDEAGGSVAVTFWAVDAVFTEPCNGDGRADPPMMRSLDGLAGAFTGWWHGDGPDPGREGYIPPIGQPSTSQPADTTVSGLRARYVELTVPDNFDADECVGGRYATWRNADGVERHHRPSDVSRIWIVAVAPFPSTPLLVIDATSQGEPSPEGLTELAVIIDSLRIEARPEEAP